MQPALIRVIDNIRKQLDDTDWQGQYEEDFIWPAETTNEQKQAYAELQKGLHGVPPEEHDRIASEMSKLPQPSPLYTLKLTKTDHPEQTIDIWATCYQVCSAMAYTPSEENVIEADTTLLNDEGEVDWLVLDEKTKSLIHNLFQSLPS